MEDKTVFRLWAKTTDQTPAEKRNQQRQDAFHPLICHLLDVAAAALELWENVLPATIKKRLANGFGLENDLETAGRFIAFLIGLHDLGKSSPPFALRGWNESSQTKRLLKLYENTDFYDTSAIKAVEAPHGFVTGIELPAILIDKFNVPPALARQTAEIIGGHHGVFPTAADLKNIKQHGDKSLGGRAWQTARLDLAARLAATIEVEADFSDLPNEKFGNAAAMMLAGLTTVADWIGSNADYFRCHVHDSEAVAKDADFTIDCAAYFKTARANARKALKESGWLNWVAVAETEKKFEELFPVLKSRRHLQDVAIEIAPELTAPGIVVVEAPMGEGKTEAAMFLADAWNYNLKQRGIYFALPTQATSNQMFGRIKRFLGARFAGENVHLLLQHGHASIDDEFGKSIRNFRNIQNIYDDKSNEREREFANVVAAEWFTYKKKGLLVPFGVGTIDQILLAALQTKHVFVRLFGLAHKTIVIDEVHAYDAYMSTLLERLLEWLAALKSPVVLLSATLPKNRRDALVRAYLRGLEQNFEDDNTLKNTGDADVYPRISYTTAKMPPKTFAVRALETSAQNTKRLQIEWKNESDFIVELKERLKNGGCAAIICNTVDRAQELFDQLAADAFFQTPAADGSPKILDLLHARFRYQDRKEREDRNLERFAAPDETGNSLHRPHTAVLIATQIIEQSLDLDFDLIISELAPADLLLQRAGRLQRHQRCDRAANFHTATFWIIEPETDQNRGLLIDDKGLPKFGKSGVVYDKHILLRTWLKLRDETKIEIPGDIERLIEDVYNPKQQCFDQQHLQLWNETEFALKSKLTDKKQKAKEVYLTRTDDDEMFESFKFELDEDDPEKHQTLRAQTRDEERPTVAVILLTAEEANSVDLDRAPDRQTAEFLIKREAKISRGGLTTQILANQGFKVAAWQKSALLRHHRLIVLDQNNERLIGGVRLILHDRKGVVYQNEGGEK